MRIPPPRRGQAKRQREHAPYLFNRRAANDLVVRCWGVTGDKCKTTVRPIGNATYLVDGNFVRNLQISVESGIFGQKRNSYVVWSEPPPPQNKRTRVHSGSGSSSSSRATTWTSSADKRSGCTSTGTITKARSSDAIKGNGGPCSEKKHRQKPNRRPAAQQVRITSSTEQLAEKPQRLD